MARPRKIDRDQLLQHAEGLIVTTGVASLTFGSLAKAAGVPKASVQSAFGTREALIQLLIERWTEKESSEFTRLAGANPSPRQRMAAHIQSTANLTDDDHSGIASMMVALISAGREPDGSRDWYASRIGDLTAQTADEKKLRIAFLATEGAFYMRYLSKFEMDDALWRELFADLAAFVGDGGDDPAPEPE